MISLNKLKKVVRARKRVGRGISGGQGKTSGRGSKGQKSRSGQTIPTGFEGGQTPLKQRLPKIRGFHRHKNIKRVNISLDQIAENYKTGESVTVGTLKQKKLIKNKTTKFKIVASKSFKSKLSFKFVPISKTAEDIAKKAGASIIKKK
jgi:large subunit ribosomal protein L15